MIRLKDIAEHAGVSVMTVSKVMHDAPDISPATKTRIKLLAQQLGYIPDSLAQGLRTRTTKLLGVLVPSTSDSLFARVLRALEESAFELGYELVLGQSFNVPEREEAVLRRFIARHVDGLFIAPVYRLAPNAPIYDEISKSLIPVVLLGHRAPFCHEFASIETDDLAASSLLTTHLIQLGHKRIAFFSGPPAAPWAQERLDGYRRALRETQFQADDGLVFKAGTTREEGRAAAIEMLKEAVHPTAIQAVNDQVALGAADHLLQQGFKIPQDISLTGFGNSLESEFYRIPLTTVRPPAPRFGSAAMESMIILLKNFPVETKRLTSELITRQSTASLREF